MNKAARNFVSSKPSYFQSTRGYKPGADRPVRYKCGFTNTILDVLRARGWQEVRGGNNDDTDWDFYWCDVGWMREVFDHLYLEEHMRVCHFRNHYELTRKNLMVKNFKRFRKQLDREFGKLEASKMDFFPASYELPTDYHMFVEEFKRQPSIWIMKPANKSQGKGIFLFRRLKDIVEWKKNSSYRSPAIQQTLPGNSGDTEREIVETYVVSKYIDNPYLIGGKKFDIRYYVLVVSYTPLKVWQYREGFARFSYSRYSLDCIEDTFVHLTNVAIQKLAPEYDPEKDCKWSIESLRTYLTARHGLEKVEQLMRAMDELVIYSLKAVQKTIINDKHCFELYGFDILLDANLKPWLLEVNASPSLTASSPQDYALKTRILDDMLNVVDMEGRLTGNERRVGGYDLIWNDGPVTCDDGGCHFTTSPVPVVNSFLGCRNDRDKQLRQLFKHSPTPKKVSTIS